MLTVLELYLISIIIVHYGNAITFKTTIIKTNLKEIYYHVQGIMLESIKTSCLINIEINFLRGTFKLIDQNILIRIFS